jgi:hypothetical protein
MRILQYSVAVYITVLAGGGATGAAVVTVINEVADEVVGTGAVIYTYKVLMA